VRGSERASRMCSGNSFPASGHHTEGRPSLATVEELVPLPLSTRSPGARVCNVRLGLDSRIVGVTVTFNDARFYTSRAKASGKEISDTRRLVTGRCQRGQVVAARFRTMDLSDSACVSDTGMALHATRCAAERRRSSPACWPFPGVATPCVRGDRGHNPNFPACQHTASYNIPLSDHPMPSRAARSHTWRRVHDLAAQRVLLKSHSDRQ